MNEESHPDKGTHRPSRTAIGRRGEELACQELQRRGYELLARNWRCPAGEVDIIARQGDSMAFVEVKTRRAHSGLPEEGLTARKMTRIITVAQTYLGQFDLGDVGWRIDLVAIELGPDGQATRIDIQPAIGLDV
jgi:putative endonuclease